MEINLTRSSINPPTSQTLKRRGIIIFIGSLFFIFFGCFCLLGGFEIFLNKNTPKEIQSEEQAIYLLWPFSLFYFWPLIIPLGTYFTIARWTGYKHFRHA